MTTTPLARNNTVQPGYRPYNPAGSHPAGTRPTGRRTPSAPVTPVPAQYWPHWQPPSQGVPLHGVPLQVAPTQAIPATGVPADASAGEVTDTAITVTIELNLDLDTAGQKLGETLASLQAALRQIGGAQLRVGNGRPNAGSAGCPSDQPSANHSDQASLVTADDRDQPEAEPLGGDRRALRILADERTVRWGSREIYLSRLEFDLLLFFAEHPRRVFGRRQLLESVWGYTQASRRTVDVHIRRLRAKLEGAGPLLATIRGIGYRLDTEARVVVVRQPRPAETVSASF